MFRKKTTGEAEIDHRANEEMVTRNRLYRQFEGLWKANEGIDPAASPELCEQYRKNAETMNDIAQTLKGLWF